MKARISSSKIILRRTSQARWSACRQTADCSAIPSRLRRSTYSLKNLPPAKHWVRNNPFGRRSACWGRSVWSPPGLGWPRMTAAKAGTAAITAVAAVAIIRHRIRPHRIRRPIIRAIRVIRAVPTFLRPIRAIPVTPALRHRRPIRARIRRHPHRTPSRNRRRQTSPAATRNRLQITTRSKAHRRKKSPLTCWITTAAWTPTVSATSIRAASACWMRRANPSPN